MIKELIYIVFLATLSAASPEIKSTLDFNTSNQEEKSQPHVISSRSVFCDAGTIRTSDGHCAPVKPKSEKSRTARNAPESPPGLVKQFDGTFLRKMIPPGLQKQKQSHVISRRNVFCDAGTVRIPDGRCALVKSKSENVRSETNGPECQPGMVKQIDGSCLRIVLPPDLNKQNQSHIITRTDAFCDAGTVRTPDGYCAPVKSKSGKSRAARNAPECPPGLVKQSDGSCLRTMLPLALQKQKQSHIRTRRNVFCDAETVLTPDGRCAPVKSRPENSRTTI